MYEYNEFEARSQYADFLIENGFIINGEPIMNGKKIRCQVQGDKGKQKSGIYKAYLDSGANGWCCNYRQLKSGASFSDYPRWRYEFTDEEKKEWAKRKREEEDRGNDPEFKKEMERRQLEREKRIAEMREQWAIQEQEYELERSFMFEELADQVDIEIHRYTESCESHPYLERKKVNSHGLRIITEEFTCENLVDGTAHPQVFRVGDLLIPLYRKDGYIASFQTISQCGKYKKFRVNAQKHGCFFVIGSDNLEEEEEILYAEGYATGESIYQISGKPVVCCFDAGNIRAVLEILRELYPNARHRICSDNDYFKWKERIEEGDERAENVGLKSALLLREEYGVGVLFPIFPKDHNGSDWNDLLVDFSLELAKDQFEYQWEYMEHHETIVFDEEQVMSELACRLKKVA